MGEIFATKSELRSGQVKVPLDTRTTIVVVPDALQCEIVGKLFDNGKTFLSLDRAAQGLRYVHRLAAYAASGKDVLIVVHTTPLRDVSKSEQLSLDRAAMVAAWFEGDVDTWLDNYADSVPKNARWGAREDHHMLSALGDFSGVIDDERPENNGAQTSPNAASAGSLAEPFHPIPSHPIPSHPSHARQVRMRTLDCMSRLMNLR